MRTRGEIKTKLQPMLLAVGTSTYFTTTRIENAIDDSYLEVATARQWPDIKKGFVTHTEATENYYDYPDNCQSESIFKISVDGDSKYNKLDFEEFLRVTEDDPTSTDKIWSEFGRQIFIFPTPATTGSNNLIFWGIIQAAPLTDDGDVTMFTDYADILNEAILQKAYSSLIQNLDSNKSLAADTKAESIITKEYKKIAQRLQRKLKDQPQFEVPDFFGTTSSSVGKFSINE